MRHNVYSIVFTKTSKKQYQSFNEKIKKELAGIFEEIAKNTLLGKPLKGVLVGARSKRIGKYRIVYKQIKKQLVIVIVNI